MRCKPPYNPTRADVVIYDGDDPVIIREITVSRPTKYRIGFLHFPDPPPKRKRAKRKPPPKAKTRTKR